MEFLTIPGRLEQVIEERAAELKAANGSVDARLRELTRQLEGVEQKRQRAIGLAVDGAISKEDLTKRLAPLDGEKESLGRLIDEAKMILKGEGQTLQAMNLVLQHRARFARAFLGSQSVGDLGKRQLAWRRQIMEATVERVTVQSDKSLDIEYNLRAKRILEILQQIDAEIDDGDEGPTFMEETLSTRWHSSLLPDLSKIS